jgi:hypothetical protein
MMSSLSMKAEDHEALEHKERLMVAIAATYHKYRVESSNSVACRRWEIDHHLGHENCRNPESSD